MCVCNGHFQKPHIPEISGADNFKGKIMHSSEYKNSEGFKDKVVCLLGAAASGIDISREIARTCSKCYLIAKKHPSQDSPFGPNNNIYRITGLVSKFTENGVLTDSGEQLPEIDIFMFCTGYLYDIPFLD